MSFHQRSSPSSRPPLLQRPLAHPYSSELLLTFTRLHIKATTPPQNAPASSSAYNAVLCTSSQTYTLRQVSTSNNIFLTSPDASGTRITATSTITSHLELLPNTSSAPLLLQPHLKPYLGWEESTDDDDEFTAIDDDLEDPVTRLSLCSELPISDGEFADAWRAAGAFQWKKNVYQPTPAVLVKALQTIFTATTAERVGIESDEGVEMEAVLKAVDDDDIPSGLIEGVVGVVCDGLETGRWKLNVERCCKIAGKAVLQAWWDEHKGRKTMVRISVASGQYLDGLTMSFSLICSMSGSCKNGRLRYRIRARTSAKRSLSRCVLVVMLCYERQLTYFQEWYTMPTPSTIRFNPSGDSSAPVVGPGTGATPAAAAASAKNKWHEKFRKGKIK